MNFPQLTEQYISLDIETKEEKDIKKYGPGSHRHYLEGEDSYILDVAISDSKNDYYFPASPELFRWLVSIQDNHTWIMHNGFYDMSWLTYEGFKPKKALDTMGLMRMLHEDRILYNLDSCAKDILGVGKDEEEIIQWCKDEGLTGKPQKWLWKMPFSLREKYGKRDSRITYDLWAKLIPEIDKQDLTYIWGIECRLLPLLYETHHRGIRIDNNRRLQASEELAKEIKPLEDWLFYEAGGEFKEGSGKDLKRIFDKLNLPYVLTDKGNPSFKSENMLPYGVYSTLDRKII